MMQRKKLRRMVDVKLHRFGNRSVVELWDVYTALEKVRRDFAQKYLRQRKVPGESRLSNLLEPFAGGENTGCSRWKSGPEVN